MIYSSNGWLFQRGDEGPDCVLRPWTNVNLGVRVKKGAWIRAQGQRPCENPLSVV
jgi:hypothetical protein